MVQIFERESQQVVDEFSSNESRAEVSKLRRLYDETASRNRSLSPLNDVLSLNGDIASDLFEGDIILTPEQWDIVMEDNPEKPLQRRQALWKTVRLWTPLGAPIVPYRFEPGFPVEEERAIDEAINFWRERTCVRFVQAASTDTAYVSFDHNAFFCASTVGKGGAKQYVTVGPGCATVGVISHELSHTLGTLHVQARADRDDYVTLDTDNIQKSMMHNFKKEPDTYGPLYNYGIPYEFGSLMHYSQYALAINASRPTIFAKPQYAQYQFSMESPRGTFYDTLLINRLYKCTDKCRNDIRCENKGVQSGADCERCFCPRGWAGVNCDKRPDDAEYINVTQNKNVTLTIRGSDHGYFKEQLYIVQASAGKRIEVVVNKVDFDWSECRLAGLEVITSSDTRKAGYRFCSNIRLQQPLVSDTNSLLLVLHVDRGFSFTVDLAFIL